MTVALFGLGCLVALGFLFVLAMVAMGRDEVKAAIAALDQRLTYRITAEAEATRAALPKRTRKPRVAS